LLAGLLVGLAPFAGFAARLLLLRGAIHLYWPLAVVIGVALLLWLGQGIRLASSAWPALRPGCGGGLARDRCQPGDRCLARPVAACGRFRALTQLLLQVVAILVYPGALTLLLFSLGAEVGAAWALAPERAGLIPATRALLAGLMPARRLGWTLPPLAGAGVLMALLATTQVAIPFNPLPPADRNLLVAMMALVGAAWMTWTWGWHRRAADPRLMLVVQFAWLVALLAPAVVQENLRPQVLGAVLVPALMPVKVSASILYLLCLPALLQLLPEAAPQGLPGASGPGRPGLEQAGFGVLRVLALAALLRAVRVSLLPTFGRRRARRAAISADHLGRGCDRGLACRQPGPPRRRQHPKAVPPRGGTVRALHALDHPSHAEPVERARRPAARGDSNVEAQGLSLVGTG